MMGDNFNYPHDYLLSISCDELNEIVKLQREGTFFQTGAPVGDEPEWVKFLVTAWAFAQQANE